jgi:hypothetical protein
MIAHIEIHKHPPKFFFTDKGGTLIITASVLYIDVYVYDDNKTITFGKMSGLEHNWGFIQLSYRPSEIKDFKIQHILYTAKRAFNPKYKTRIFSPYRLEELKFKTEQKCGIASENVDSEEAKDATERVVEEKQEMIKDKEEEIVTSLLKELKLKTEKKRGIASENVDSEEAKDETERVVEEKQEMIKDKEEEIDGESGGT